MDIVNLKVGFSEAISSVSGSLKDSLSFLKDMKDMSMEKLNALVNDILGLAPLIEVAGFSMNDISIDIGIPPGISISFSKEKDTDPETIEKLLRENEDKEILRIIVKGLQKADSVQKAMNLHDYKFRGLSMKIGLPPDMSLKFSRS